MLAKLRTSSHSLHVEMGRRSGTSRERRLCHCGLAVEDERHFLLECETYDELRNKYKVVGELHTILADRDYIEYIAELMERRSVVRGSKLS